MAVQDTNAGVESEHNDLYFESRRMKSQPCDPIICPRVYVYEDCYVPREVPVIQPVIRVRRNIIVNVPRHYVQPGEQQVTIDPGCPNPCRG
jgi:hypothetical protein